MCILFGDILYLYIFLYSYHNPPSKSNIHQQSNAFNKKNNEKMCFFIQVGKCLYSSQKYLFLMGQMIHKVKSSREPII